MADLDEVQRERNTTGQATPARDITEAEWNEIEATFVDNKTREFLLAIKSLRGLRNKPTTADKLLGPRAHSGNEKMNEIFARCGICFQFTRIGPIAQGDRNSRKLALVRWPREKKT
ncbi:MAG TPA: hypothetical protein VGP13_02820 [Candidatus Paceibacterota bacterium]|jgi:hypothetical protein|nr:hypothetical protein [Candidatus Paceibacterota bacterium]